MTSLAVIKISPVQCTALFARAAAKVTALAGNSRAGSISGKTGVVPVKVASVESVGQTTNQKSLKAHCQFIQSEFEAKTRGASGAVNDREDPEESVEEEADRKLGKLLGDMDISPWLPCEDAVAPEPVIWYVRRREGTSSRNKTRESSL